MGIGGGRLALRQPIPVSTGAVSIPGGVLDTPDTIAGLTGWWDASTLAHLSGPSGQPVSAWRGQCVAINDRSVGGQPMTSYRFLSDGRLAAPFPHLSGTLGGVGRIQPEAGLLNPAIDPDQGFQIAQGAFGSQAAWTWYFVWSRPNWRQGSFRDTDPVPLLRSQGTTVLQADSVGSQRRLLLFPGSNQVVLTTTLQRRHTHSIMIRHVPGQGLTVWLDDVQVAEAIPNSMPASPQGPTLFLHDGTFMGGAQCWFHEAAVWGRALAPSDMATLRIYAGRWHRGPRKGLFLVINGQSNAVNYALNDGAAALLVEGVTWHLGALASNVLATTGNPASHTMQSGHGLYPVQGGTYPGNFLHDPQDGSDPGGWNLGADGIAVQAAIQALPQEDRDDIRAIVWPWNETDSLRTAGELTTFRAAAARFLGLERGMVGRTAAELPLIWWNAIPYGSVAGTAMHRRAVQTLSETPTAHVVIGNPQTADSNQRGATWDPATGLASGGDAAHRDGEDNRRFARLATAVVARAVLSAGGGDSVGSIPPELPAQGGPRIFHAYRQSSISILLTIQHDGGSDLIVPRQAAFGKGFAVTDGSLSGGSGAVVAAVACQRISATELRLTLAQPLQHASTLCGLHYPYGNEAIGRGNAVTDNFADRPKPVGWDIGADLGFAWTVNYPLAATFVPLPLSDTPFQPGVS